MSAKSLQTLNINESLHNIKSWGEGLHLFITFPVLPLLTQYEYDSYLTSVFGEHGAKVSDVKMGNSKPVEATLLEKRTLRSLLINVQQILSFKLCFYSWGFLPSLGQILMYLLALIFPRTSIFYSK